MRRMIKDALVTTLVVGAFITGAVGLFREVRRPWPQTELAAQSQPLAEQGAVTYFITATKTLAP